MKNPNIFTRSSYTFFNSLLKIDDIINLTIGNGFSNAFLIDKNIMYGAMEFYFKSIKNGIKPIIGLQLENKIVIAKNNKGYKKLIEISSKIELKSNYDLNNDGLIILDFKVNPVLYRNPNDIKTLKDFYSISHDEEFNEPSTHFLSRQEFEVIYGKDILNKIDDIIDQVDFQIEEKKNILPSFKIKNKEINHREYLEDLLKKNLKNLLNSNKELNRENYIKRVSYELKVISKMGFESYFLIVSDIVSWAKSKNIFVGPGRGSSPGSLISYLLDITTIDPIKNNLLFERFLNPERISMPDIDIDFEDRRRDEVIEYISNRYGKNNVAQIITFQTLRARMSFKDIARIRGLSAHETNLITKLIPEELSLKEAYRKNKRFKSIIDSSEQLLNIYKSAKLIEGLPRQFSTHAAGVVISDKPIFESVPIKHGYSNILLTQYSMDYMEYNGLLKIDILGLRNLSFLREILNTIKENKNKVIKLKQINFNDPKVYSLFSSGKTSGIFQLESPGMKSSLKDIRVSKFEDIVAVTSLFRPGPMKMISHFAKRKHKHENIKYFNDDIKKILEPTYGIIVYQEQIMQIVQIFSNFTLSKSDILRRAIGKKDIKLLESLKEEFFKGAKKNGYDSKEIKEIYDLIYEFSNYGFNRSHAFAYSVISYWLGWLKINFPLEFMNSLLNSVIGNVNKISLYISECEDMGIKVNEPSIFKSKGNNKIIGEDIYIGLRQIKKVGESIINIIASMKNINKDMKFIDFMIESELHGLSQSSIEILIKANALRDFGLNKQTLLDSLSKIYDYLNIIKVQKNNKVFFDKKIIEEPIIDIKKEVNEKEYFIEVMGFSIVDKNIEKEFNILAEKLNLKISSLKNLVQDERVIFIGEVISIRKITTKTNKNMAFASLTNGKRKINATYWPATFDKFEELLVPGIKYIFYGQVDLKRGETIIINKMEVIE